jgi:hypothetical protein
MSTKAGGAAGGPLREQLREEIELVERFVDCYRRQFDALIARLNDGGRATASAGNPQTVRLCVEAVNMMLDSHGRLARTLRHLAAPAAPPRAAAA